MKDIQIMDQIKVAMKVMFKLKFVSQDKAQTQYWMKNIIRFLSYIFLATLKLGSLINEVTNRETQRIMLDSSLVELKIKNNSYIH